MTVIGRKTPDFQIVGTQQSPIHILSADAVPAKYGLHHIRFGYTGRLPGKYDHGNFVFDQPSGNEAAYTITVGRTSWLLRKIHIHHKAEHLVDDRTVSDFECHLLHSAPYDPSAAGDKLVLGVFFHLEHGTGHKESLYELNAKLKGRTKDSGEPDCQNLPGHLDPREFLPETDAARADWFHYMGSLTSPPFSENVSWYVVYGEIPVNPDDIDQVQRCANQEARPVYPLNRRFVLRNVFDPKESPGQMA